MKIRRAGWLSLLVLGAAMVTAQPAVRAAARGIDPAAARVDGTIPAARWWSFHANLRDASGRRLFLSGAFFRYALSRREAIVSAEFSLLDVQTAARVQAARTARVFVASSASDDDGAHIAVGRWQFSSIASPAPAGTRFFVRAEDRGVRFDLAFVPERAPTPSPAFDGKAFTRLRVSGSVGRAGHTVAVTGSAWLDAERETTFAADRVGWERFELQLSDGADVELFTGRRADGRYRPAGSAIATSDQLAGGHDVPIAGFYLSPSGTRHTLRPADVMLLMRGDTYWHSPHDGASYPDQWWLSITATTDDDLQTPLALAPVVLDQELIVLSGVPAWIGALDVAEANPPGRPRGHGYVELTGFAIPTPL